MARDIKKRAYDLKVARNKVKNIIKNYNGNNFDLDNAFSNLWAQQRSVSKKPVISNFIGTQEPFGRKNGSLLKSNWAADSFNKMKKAQKKRQVNNGKD